jgi:hypothetical protein
MVNSLIVEFEATLILDCKTDFKTLNQKGTKLKYQSLITNGMVQDKKRIKPQ